MTEIMTSNETSAEATGETPKRLSWPSRRELSEDELRNAEFEAEADSYDQPQVLQAL